MRNITGQTFNYLTAIKIVGNDEFKRKIWQFRCICGNVINYLGFKVIQNDKKSCGCKLPKQPLRNHRVYNIYYGMLDRCKNANNISKKYYLNKNVKVCTRWIESFQNFIDDMGLPEPNQTLDRIDSNGDYCKENCRWATIIEQQNNMSNNVIITLDGISKTLPNWAREIGISASALRMRYINMKWSAEESLKIPLGVTRKQYHEKKKSSHS